MKTYASFVTELFDQKVAWKWTIRADDIWEAEFKVDDDDIECHFNHLEDYDLQGELSDTGAWEVGFSRNGRFGLTKGGSALVIFGTIKDILFDFMTKEKPKSLQFNGYGKSRMKLYTRMIKQLGRKFNMKSGISSNGTVAKDFTLKK